MDDGRVVLDRTIATLEALLSRARDLQKRHDVPDLRGLKELLSEGRMALQDTAADASPIDGFDDAILDLQREAIGCSGGAASDYIKAFAAGAGRWVWSLPPDRRDAAYGVLEKLPEMEHVDDLQVGPFASARDERALRSLDALVPGLSEELGRDLESALAEQAPLTLMMPSRGSDGGLFDGVLVSVLLAPQEFVEEGALPIFRVAARGQPRNTQLYVEMDLNHCVMPNTERGMTRLVQLYEEARRMAFDGPFELAASVSDSVKAEFADRLQHRYESRNAYWADVGSPDDDRSPSP